MKEVENIIDEKKQGEAASPAKKVTTILSTFADDSKEEQDSWRAEILTELVSDQFEENVETFKDNLFYREVMKEYDRVWII